MPASARTLWQRYLVSGAGTGSKYHVDPLNTSAWNSLLLGRKRWAVYPPGTQFPPGLDPAAEYAASVKGARNFFDAHDPFAREMGWWGLTAPWAARKTSPLEYFQTVLPGVPPEQRPIECMQRPGETVVIPAGHWHTVLNMLPAVAVTENQVTSAGIQNFLGELDRRPQYVFLVCE